MVAHLWACIVKIFSIPCPTWNTFWQFIIFPQDFHNCTDFARETKVSLVTWGNQKGALKKVLWGHNLYCMIQVNFQELFLLGLGAKHGVHMQCPPPRLFSHVTVADGHLTGHVLALSMAFLLSSLPNNYLSEPRKKTGSSLGKKKKVDCGWQCWTQRLLAKMEDADTVLDHMAPDPLAVAFLARWKCHPRLQKT